MSLFNGATKTAMQPVALDGPLPDYCYSRSRLVAKRRGELRCCTANCRDWQDDLLVVRIARDRVYRARITRGNGREAVLRGDKNRLVPLECGRVDESQYLVTSEVKFPRRSAAGCVARRDDVVAVARIEPDFVIPS